MTVDHVPEAHELKNKPLVEAIFELRWALKVAGQGLPPQDPGFHYLLGRYYDRVREQYPVAEDLPSSQVPVDLTAFTVRHRFRAEKDGWPLTQIGPGVLTVNDTTGYTWSTFRPRLLTAIEALFGSYPKDITPFIPAVSQLRYINAIPYEPSERSVTQFLSDFLHTQVSVHRRLFDDPQHADRPFRLNMNITYPLQTPKGYGILAFANKSKDFEPRVILEIIVRSTDDDVPKEPESFETWLEDAHAVIDKWFFALCEGELLASFERGEAHEDG